MKITTREATPADAEAIAKLTEQLGYVLPVIETSNNLELLGNNENEMVVVAEMENEVAGWIHVSTTISLESIPFGEIRGLVVEERHHQKGIGRLLLENAKAWCVEKGLQKLRVRSQIKRKDAHTFYLGYGFSETKVQMVFDLQIS